MIRVPILLEPGVTGAPVAILHAALELLDYHVPAPEKNDRRFGDATISLVKQFQRDNHLQPTGKVDEATAAAFNNATVDAELINELKGHSGYLKDVNQKLGTLQAIDNKLGGLQSIDEKLSGLRSIDDKLGGLKNIDDKLTGLKGIDDKLVGLKNIDDKLGGLKGIDDKLVGLKGIDDKLGGLKGIDSKLGDHTTKLGNIEAGIGALGDISKSQHLIRGHVRLENGRPFAGCVVRAFHTGPQGKVTLGEASVDAEGNYTLRYGLLPGVQAINLSVVAVDASGAPLSLPVVKNPAASLEILDLVLPMAGVPGLQRWIQGQLVFEHGLPGENVTLRLYRREYGGQATKLAETTTVAGGQYAFTFDPGGNAVSLEVRAVKGAQEIALTKPSHDLRGESGTILNLGAPRDLQTDAQAEYRRLSEDLKPHVQTTTLAQAKEDDKHQDLTVLSRVTGWDARLIALAAATERLCVDPDVQLSPEVVYGLLRAGLPHDKLLLAQVQPDVAERALKTALAAGIIAPKPEEITQFTPKFTALVNKVRLSLPVPGSGSTYGALLKTSGLPGDVQDKFAPVYLAHRGERAQLWEAARNAGLKEPEITRLQFHGKLAFLTGNSEAMTARLMAKKLSDPSQLVDQDLHRAASWVTEVFQQAGVPENHRNNLTDEEKKKLDAVIPAAYAGEKVEDRLDAYADDMARKLRLSYPTHVVGRMIEQDEIKLPAARDATMKLLKSAAGQGFRLGQTPITSFFESHVGVRGTLTDRELESAHQQMSTLQRVYQITPSNEAMPVLMSLGMTSAHDVMAYSAEEFITHYDSKYFEINKKHPAPGEPQLVYRKAKQVSSVTYNLFTIAKKLDSEPAVAGLSAPVEVRDKVRDELIRQFPTLQGLLGSMDFCECEHCRSVLSPAAYLMDLLQFLDPEAEVWANFLAQWKATHGNQDYPHKDENGNPMGPYDVLVRRRPDLPNIPFTCENTHTALPYIDIVNEILEYYVAYGKLAEEAAHDTGDATTPELLAEPQNVIRGAYDRLREDRYPLNLPFDLSIETVRQFCDYFETPLSRVMEALRPSDDLFAPAQPFDRSSIFNESLGLSPAELALFTDPDPLADLKWYALYGFPTVRSRLQNPTNAVHATLTVANADAQAFTEGVACTYFDVSANALSNASNTISAIGAPDSGGAGQTLITLAGVWTAPPDAGDLFVYHVVAMLQSAKALSYRLGVTYKELAEIVQTGFVNPKLAELSLLNKLGVSIHDTRFYLAHKNDPPPVTPDEQKRRLEVNAFVTGMDKLAQTFNVPRADLEAALQVIPFDRILVLADPDTGCDFDLTTVRYANGDPADGIVFLRINMFVRLWRKLGWSIEETDRALQAFVPRNTPFETAQLAKQPLKSALIYLAHLKALDEKLRAGKQSRSKLITLWSDIAATGERPLYAQLFLTRSVLKSGEVEVNVSGQKQLLSVFDDPLGRYLDPGNLAKIAEQVRYEVRLQNIKDARKIDPAPFAAEARMGLHYDALGEAQYLSYLGVLTDSEKARLTALSPSPELKALLNAVQSKGKEFTLVKGHLLALEGALGLTADDIGRILKDAGTTLDKAELSLPSVSVLYRYGLLSKALKLSVRELIALKQLSGLNPFTPLHPDPLADIPAGAAPAKKAIEIDYPFSQTLRFVEVAEEVKESGFKVEDLEYLLRHRFDETGKYRPDREGTLAFLRSLAGGIRDIRTGHALPEDPGAMGEEVLRQKLGLTLSADVVERFLAMMNGTAEFTATRSAPAPLKPEEFAGEPAIRELSYNGTRHEQKLTFRGVLFDAEKADLKNRLPKPVPPATHVPSQVFSDLLDDIQQQARSFFQTYLQKQPQNAQPGGGFLEAGDFDLLFDRNLALGMGESEQDRVRARQARVTNAFLPFLQQRLIRQFILQTMTAQTGADPVLVESLVTDERLLSGPKPLLEALSAVGDVGLSASFFDSDNESGNRQATSPIVTSADTALKDSKDKDGHPLNPANSARFEGYLEVATPGAYRFLVAVEKNAAEATLSFDHLPNPLFWKEAAAADNALLGTKPNQFLELKPGILYRFRLDLKKLNGGAARLQVQGETLPRGSVSQLKLYPLSAMDGAERALLLLSKVLQVVQTLGLSEREIRYLLTHAASFGGLNLSQLPTQSSADSAAEKLAAARRFDQYQRLAAYTRLKLDLAAGTDDLIDLFEANGTGGAEKVYPLFAKLTRRDEDTVRTTARALAAAPVFASEQPLERLWEALQVVERFGVPVTSLLEWTRITSTAAAPEQRFDIAHDLKEAIKARLEPETWMRVAQPIFDRLRQRQRDALVAHVMHQHGFARIEQLYEYFLIDPGMEPVVQTSRIRLAIASVQLFIQRCLLNMELQVHPSVINSRQWEWMKRYRVWEANRKIFLYPENWLEPEFRDDKTHLFAELEGNLLQGDVSSDLVEDAFLNYLKKLDELARLDIVAMHLQDNSDPALRTLHVIGRTYGNPHKYFYRRYVHQMWTPWEPVTAEIEGDHLVPVVWRDRLYLFWVTFMEKADPKAEPGVDGENGRSASNLMMSEIVKSARKVLATKQVDVQLHWSEYLQGAWTTRESGGFSAWDPKTVSGSFEPKSVFVHVSKEYAPDPQSNGTAGEERGVYVHLGGEIDRAFYLASRNSTPESALYGADGKGPKPGNPYSNASKPLANRYSGKDEFKVVFQERITTAPGKTPPPATPNILGRGGAYTLLPCDNNLTALGVSPDAYQNAANPDAVEAAIERGIGEIASLMKPVFYQDNAHTLFVEPSVTEQTVEEWQEWITRTPEPEPEWHVPDWWNHGWIVPDRPWEGPIPDPADPWHLAIDPGSIIEPIAGRDWLVNPGTALLFDGVLIGPRGRTGLEVSTAGGITEGGVPVNVNPGSALPSDTTVVLTGSSTLEQAGLTEVAGRLNVVGSSGFNSALRQGFDEMNSANVRAGVFGNGRIGR